MKNDNEIEFAFDNDEIYLNELKWNLDSGSKLNHIQIISCEYKKYNDSFTNKHSLV